ncbi:hypothetical protein [Bauldia sp.]|uniref:hypothetical protein n=1 Tax=Bauldia sp. TaxID=2575872 RepID=UPI003BA9BC01
MDTSRNIAAIMGPTIMAATALETLNFHIWEGIHPTTVFNNGILWFTGGLAVVWFHNLWVRDWRVIVTLLGWLSLIAGLFRMAFPDGPQAAPGIGAYAVIGLLFLAAAVISWMAYLTKGES